MLIDTDVLIGLLREQPPAAAWLEGLETVPFVCGISAMELIQDVQNKAGLQEAQELLNDFVLLWPDAEQMQRTLTEYLPLHLAHGIGLLDSLIAATAVGTGMPLLTFNVKHFRHIPDLVTVQPYRR